MNSRVQVRFMVALASILVLSAFPAMSGEEERGYLGVSCAQVERLHGPEDDGVYVSTVAKGSGAEIAGIKAHDLILKIGGRTIESHGDVMAALDNTRPGDTVQVTVRRGTEEMTYDVLLGDPPRKIELNVSTGPHWVYELDGSERPTLGVQAMSLNPQLAAYFDVTGGVLVTQVPEKGPAWQAGLRAGDVIVGWNGSGIEGKDHLYAKLAGSKPGELVDVEVRRRDRLERFTVALGQPEKQIDLSATIHLRDIELKEEGEERESREEREEEERP